MAGVTRPVNVFADWVITTHEQQTVRCLRILQADLDAVTEHRARPRTFEPHWPRTGHIACQANPPRQTMIRRSAATYAVRPPAMARTRPVLRVLASCRAGRSGLRPYPGAHQALAVAHCHAGRLFRPAAPVQRREEASAAVAGIDLAGTISAVGRGRQADDQHSRPRRPSREWGGPVRPPRKERRRTMATSSRQATRRGQARHTDSRATSSPSVTARAGQVRHVRRAARHRCIRPAGSSGQPPGGTADPCALPSGHRASAARVPASDQAIPSRMSCSLTSTSPKPNRSMSRSSTSAPPPITSTAPVHHADGGAGGPGPGQQAPGDGVHVSRGHARVVDPGSVIGGQSQRDGRDRGDRARQPDQRPGLPHRDRSGHCVQGRVDVGDGRRHLLDGPAGHRADGARSS